VRIAVITDIHGNWHALAAVLDEITAEEPDEVWCLGDLVGYGPQPNRCVSETKEHADLCLVGNHDLGVLGRIDIGDFTPDAATVVRWTADNLEADARSYLGELEAKGERDDVQVFHGSPRDPVWEYILSEEAARAALEQTTAPLVLVGHSHIPIALRLTNGNQLAGGLAKGGTGLELSEGRWLLNPGSVGQPRDGDPRAAYLWLDLGAHEAEFRRVAYNVQRTQKEILQNGLPESLAARLANGE
jgi:predicted phosphodiesterase